MFFIYRCMYASKLHPSSRLPDFIAFARYGCIYYTASHNFLYTIYLVHRLCRRPLAFPLPPNADCSLRYATAKSLSCISSNGHYVCSGN